VRKLHLLAPLVVSCSSGAKTPVTPEPTPEPVATADAAPPEISDAELCPTLIARFREESGAGSLKPEELERMTAAVRKHCPTWPPAVTRCLVTSPDDRQTKCMDDLDQGLRTAFIDDIMASFNTPVPGCEELVYDVTAWATLPTTLTNADDRAVALAAIQPVVLASCKGTWSEDVRTCVGAPGGAVPRACLDTAGGTVGADLDREIKRRTDLFAVAAAFKPTDKKIACAKAVAAHYGAARWNGKLDGKKAADRKRIMKASTAAFAAACKDEKWTGFVRGCVVAATSEEERAWCLGGTTRWGYPAGAAEPTAAGMSGVPECDAYVAAMKRYIACDEIPQAARDAAQGAMEAMTSAWSTGLPDEARDAAADACTQGLDAIKQGAVAFGCPMP